MFKNYTMTNSVDPNDIGKHPNLIKSAQKEISELDVLYCGKCHAVYHHVEAFTEHKSRPCKVDSTTLKDYRETKAKVWAFLLWKASQLARMESNTINSWRLYKEWIELDEDVRQTWIIAGEIIQSFDKMGQGNLQEMPMKATKHAIRDPNLDESSGGGGYKGMQVKSVIKTMKAPKPQSPVQTPLRQIQQRPGLTVRKLEVAKPEPVLLDKLIANVQNKTFFAKHYDADENVLRQFKVEKILAKRFNQRKRMHEYLVKWAQTEQLDSNTWEPQTHLETCEPLLEIFETQLAKNNEARAKLQQAFDQTKKAPQSTPRVVASRPGITKPTVINRSNFSGEDGSIKRKNLDSDYDTTTEDGSSFDKPRPNKRFKTNIGGGGRQIQPIIGRTSNSALLRAPAAAEVVTGEDGTIYQVAGKNTKGQTILIPQGGEDGEQQCLVMASDDGQNVLQMVAAGQVTGQEMAQGDQQEIVAEVQSLTIQTGDSEDGQITAEVVQADLPSPGGTRRLVLMLPDGSFMMSKVNEEQYQSLNLVN